MRVVGPLLGVVVGVVLGFGLHSLLMADGDRDAPRSYSSVQPLAASRSGPRSVPRPPTPSRG